jgi:hypothetical protein
MLVRESNVVFKDAPGTVEGTQLSKCSLDETALLNDIINKSRHGAGAYLLRIKEHLQYSSQFVEFLRIVKDLKDKRRVSASSHGLLF